MSRRLTGLITGRMARRRVRLLAPRTLKEQAHKRGNEAEADGEGTAARVIAVNHAAAEEGSEVKAAPAAAPAGARFGAGRRVHSLRGGTARNRGRG